MSHNNNRKYRQFVVDASAASVAGDNPEIR